MSDIESLPVAQAKKIKELESTVSTLRGELAEHKKHVKYLQDRLQDDANSLATERDTLRGEVERLKGKAVPYVKDPSPTYLELTAERDRYRLALEKIAMIGKGGCDDPDCGCDEKIAKQALSGGEK